MPSRAAADPRELRPMLATPAKALPPDDGTWAHEMKWDGMRVLAIVHRGRLTVISRAGNDATERFPELAGLPDALGCDAVLDGEVVALGPDGAPSFELLQPRMQARGATAVARVRAVQPVVCMWFDVLSYDGHDVTPLPYTERRALLDRLSLAGPHWQTPPVAEGAGQVALTAAEQLGLEGVVSKRRDSPYLPGRRSEAWRKVKVSAGQELVVGGWLPGKGRLDGRLGSLLVGYHDATTARDELRYAGRVGSGIDERRRVELEDALRDTVRRESPFLDAPRLPGAVWVEPELVVQVRFHEWTSAGVLRAPRFQGLRDDKAASDVVRET
ncbi:MAG: non-homologous end-joining DNA ligase [Acidimicrobiia bacterium]